jgi:hypothetical protein
MQTMTTAATLNAMIQRHIDSLSIDGYVSHSGVYLHPADRSGCNWNIEVNCNHDALTCGPSISRYIDLMRSSYGIAPDDKTAVIRNAPHGTRRTRGAAAGSNRLFD